MINRSATALLLALAGSRILHAQTFTVDKWNIGGPGGTDYITAEAGTGRVFVSRGSHVMVLDGATGKVIGEPAITKVSSRTALNTSEHVATEIFLVELSPGSRLAEPRQQPD